MADDAKAPGPKKPSGLALVSGGIGAVAGFALSRYCGFAFYIPVGLTLLVGWPLAKAVPLTNKPMVPASAVQTGHGLWMLLGMVLLSRFDLMLIDVAILIGGAIWLAARPSIGAVGLMICYQIAGLGVNGFVLADATPNSDIHKALVVHVLFRALAIASMVYGLIEIAKQKKAAALRTLSEPNESAFTDNASESAPSDHL